MKKIKKGKLLYYGVTPGGTLLVETKGRARWECIKNLLIETSHMPYRNWKDLKERGYTIEELDATIYDF